jgi:hypothetical protein
MAEVNFLVKKGLTVPKGSASTPSVIFDASDPNTGLYSPGADQVAVATNGAGRVFVDASGRIGIAGSPSASSNTYLQVGYAGIGSDHVAYNYDSYFANNLYKSANSAWSRISTRAGGLLRIEDDTFTYSTADSGTAGASATLSERLRITSAGLVGIGTSSPAGRLEIKDNGYRQGIVLERAGTSVDRAFIYIGDGTNSTAADDFYLDANNAAIHFRQGGGGTTDTVTFTSSGNVGIGTTSPGHLLQVSDKFAVDTSNTFGRIYLQRQLGTSLTTMYIQGADQANTATDLSIVNTSGGGSAIEIAGGTSPAAIKFFTNGSTTERARIDSSGRLLVGTSSAQYTPISIASRKSSGANMLFLGSDSLADDETVRLFVQHGAGVGNHSSEIGIAKHSGIADVCSYIQLGGVTSGIRYFWVDDSGDYRLSSTFAYIGTTSGTVVGTQTSDERIKNILGPVEYGLNTINQIEPVRYTLKTAPNTERLGFVAQQVRSLVPQSVFDTDEHIEGEPEDAPTKLGMEYVALIPVLVNAIKELSAEVDALKAQLA